MTLPQAPWGMLTPGLRPALRLIGVTAELAASVYRVAELLPASEARGIADQLRRAAVSVGCNVTEGNGRTSRREFLRHLGIARGSLREVEALLVMCRALRYASPETLGAAEELLDRSGRMLTRLIQRVREGEGGGGGTV